VHLLIVKMKLLCCLFLVTMVSAVALDTEKLIQSWNDFQDVKQQAHDLQESVTSFKCELNASLPPEKLELETNLERVTELMRDKLDILRTQLLDAQTAELNRLQDAMDLYSHYSLTDFVVNKENSV
jgi:hypothetical protein